MYAAWLFLFVSCGLDDGAGPPNHFVQRSTRSDHGINGIFLLHLEIDQHRAIVGSSGANGGHYIRTLVAHDALDAVGRAQLGEIRAQKWGSFVVAIIEEFLPLSNHAEV